MNGLFDDVTTKELQTKSQGYGWPKFGHNAELRSLIQHIKIHNSVLDDPMSDYIETLVFEKMRNTLGTARYSTPSDFMSREHFDRVLSNIDMSSSPGLPWSRIATTNRGLFYDNDGHLLPAKVEWMWNLVSNRLQVRDADPIKMFVKAEPVKQAKLDEGRYRLISAISIVDQIIDQMIFGWQNEVLMEQWLSLPMKVGWSPLVGGWKLMSPSMRIAIDKKAWDWTVKSWMLETELKLRVWLAKGNDLFKDLATWRYRMLFENPLLVLSSGIVLAQRCIGIMKSGSVNTIMSNSIMQLILHYRVSAELMMDPGVLWSMGDDTLQTPVEDLQSYMQRLRKYCLAKDPVNGVEFAGFKFTNVSVEPMYQAKHAFNLLHFDSRFKSDILISYSILYHRSHLASWVHEALRQLGEPPSPRFLDVVWDGEE